MKARLLYARLDSLQEDYTGNDPDVIALRYAADYDAETARADRAEAGCAAMRTALSDAISLTSTPEHAQDAEWYAERDRLVIVERADHPGSRFLELAGLVEGLPKVDMVWRQSHKAWFIEDVETGQQLYDALARLLAWQGVR